ncbi:MAG: carbohydrate kinase family protein [Myxococcota bacterium]
MPVLVTGSIAFDHIMVFEDRFRNHILPDKVHMLNVAFLVPTMERRWGGCAANIAFNLKRLGGDPIVLGTAGKDFGPYTDWLDRHQIRRDHIHVLDDAYTAQAFITTDLDDNQITAFHPGAMDRAHEAPVDGVGDDFSVGIVGPNGKQAMQEHARALKERGVACVVDPGQGLPMFDGGEILELMDGAALYVVNDYEWALTQERTGLDEEEVVARADALIVTRGELGSLLVTPEGRVEIPAVKAEQVVDPTGCGDAYRAGLLYALEKGLSLETGARAGALLGALKVAAPGPQSITLDTAAIRARYESEFGEPLG